MVKEGSRPPSMGQAGPGGNSRPRDFDGLPGGERGPGGFKSLPPWAGAPEVFLSPRGAGDGTEVEPFL